jgi:hypothetical protein
MIPLIGPPAHVTIPAERPRATKCLRVLLVEDNKDVADCLAEMIDLAGFDRSAFDPGDGAALNFEQGSYTDKNSQQRPLIRFSDGVLLNVVAAVGGKVEHQLLHRANLELNRLKEAERAGAGRFQGRLLRLDALAVCRNSRITNDHFAPVFLHKVSFVFSGSLALCVIREFCTVRRLRPRCDCAQVVAHHQGGGD